MGYHDRDTFERRWRMPKEEDKQKQSENPRMQIISPQKKLYDIQQILNNLTEQTVLSANDLKIKIQGVLDGE
tara:strand:+ start:81 stop:296 length:216 start_codon:yes stop_codon:yes gene_type:complete